MKYGTIFFNLNQLLLFLMKLSTGPMVHPDICECFICKYRNMLSRWVKVVFPHYSPCSWTSAILACGKKNEQKLNDSLKLARFRMHGKCCVISLLTNWHKNRALLFSQKSHFHKMHTTSVCVDKPEWVNVVKNNIYLIVNWRRLWEKRRVPARGKSFKSRENWKSVQR